MDPIGEGGVGIAQAGGVAGVAEAAGGRELDLHQSDAAAASDQMRLIAAFALDHAMQLARGLDRSRADTFVGMYVNDWTLDYGDRGRKAVRLFLERGHEAGLIPNPVQVEFVDG